VTEGGGTRPRGRAVAIGAVLVSAAVLFSALGVWQVQRLSWKLNLIAEVDRRVHAPPAPAPGPASWAALTQEHDAYRRVRDRGVFLNDRESLVQAVTEKGPGFWVMTPLKTDGGFTVLVNRGFIPAEAAPSAFSRVNGETTVTGLLRITEPKGGFLRRNDPSAHRWYSRDVAAIAAADGLHDAAPYFIDADAAPNPGGWPLGGLTVVHFRNSHLSYALTWFALAAMAIGWIIYGLRGERRAGRGS
jgi:surfeit locus 1 family protein